MGETAYERATAWAAHWSQRWFLDADGEDRLLLRDGVSAGWASHTEAYLLLHSLALEELGVWRPRPPILDRLKAHGLDRSARAWGLRFARSSVASGVRKPNVAFVVEIPTPSMLEPTRLVAQVMRPEQRMILCADPRALRRLRRSGLDAAALVVPMVEQQRLLRAASVDVADMLGQLNDSPPSMPLDGKDVGTQAFARLCRALRRSLPWMAVEHQALRTAIESLNPGALAVASDQHRVGRIAVQVASALGLSTTVLQHGLPQAEIGYLPVVAHRVAAWSSDAASWFEGHGTDAARLTILGNPRADLLAVDRTRRSQRSNGSESRLLLALSLSAVSTNTRVVATVLEALAAMPGAQLVIKLHPGHRRWAWVSDLVRTSADASRVRIVQHEDAVGLLRWADVTLVHRSTMALDSLVTGTPVVVVSSDAPSVADIELPHLDLPVARVAADVVSWVDNVTDPRRREAWLEAREPAIVRAAGPLDGRSAERIAGQLLEDADAAPAC